jgi:hypothetical protein
MRELMERRVGNGRELRYVTTVTESPRDATVRFMLHSDATLDGRPIGDHELRHLLVG